MSEEPVRSIVQRAGDVGEDFVVFTEAALAAQDGKKVSTDS
jgi:hypothetical protein